MTRARESTDAVVPSIAAAQRTIVSHEQLIANGCGRRLITSWVNRHRLNPVFHGVYSVVRGELPQFALEQAAVLACGESAFLSHRSAAFCWGLLKHAPAPVEVSVCGRHCSTRPGLRVHRIGAIDRRELRLKDGVWVSSPARVALEVAAVAPDELADVLDEGLGRRLFDRRELEAVLARNRPCRGAARLAALLGDESAMTITRSRAEKDFLKLIRESGLPVPETDVKFGRCVADFVWRRERLIVELDTPTFHGGPRAFQNDREKDLVYRDAGFECPSFHARARGPWAGEGAGQARAVARSPAGARLIAIEAVRVVLVAAERDRQLLVGRGLVPGVTGLHPESACVHVRRLRAPERHRRRVIWHDPLEQFGG